MLRVVKSEIFGTRRKVIAIVWFDKGISDRKIGVVNILADLVECFDMAPKPVQGHTTYGKGERKAVSCKNAPFNRRIVILKSIATYQRGSC